MTAAAAGLLATALFARKEDEKVYCLSKAPNAQEVHPFARYVEEPVFFVLTILGRLLATVLILALFYPVLPPPAGLIYYGFAYLTQFPGLRFVASAGAMLCSFSLYIVPLLGLLYAAVEPGVELYRSGQSYSARLAGFKLEAEDGGKIGAGAAAAKGGIYALETAGFFFTIFKTISVLGVVPGVPAGLLAGTAVLITTRAVTSLLDGPLGVRAVPA